MKVFILVFLMLLLNVRAAVIISEIMFNPLGNGNDDEFVEIYNDSEEEVNLNGWGISDQAETDRLLPYPGFTDLVLKPYSYCLIMDSSYPERSVLYEELIPDSTLRVVIEDGSFGSYGLSNSNPETIALYDQEDSIVDAHIYSIDQEKGISDERYNAEVSALWYNSLHPHGTPGFKNSVSRRDHDLVLYMTDFEDNANLNSDYYLDFYVKNEGFSTAQDYSYQLLLNGEVLSEQNLTTVLAEDDSIFIQEELQFTFSGEHTFSLNILYEMDENPDNNFFDSLVFVAYPASSLVLNEFMKKPLTGNCEWFELTNISEFPLKLSDFRFSDSSSDSLVFFTDGELYNGVFFVLAGDSSIFSEYPNLNRQSVEVNTKLPSLSDDDALYIYDRSGSVIDSITFQDDWGEENGRSLEKINPFLVSDLVENWAVSVGCGTPGDKNSVYQGTGSLANKNTILLADKLISANGDGKKDNLVINYEFDSPFVYLTAYVFNIKGQKVAEILNNDYRSAKGSIVWNCTEKGEHKVSMGAYVLYMKVKESSGRLYEFKKPFYVIK